MRPVARPRVVRFELWNRERSHRRPDVWIGTFLEPAFARARFAEESPTAWRRGSIVLEAVDDAGRRQVIARTAQHGRFHTRGGR